MSDRQLRIGLPKGSLQNSTVELFRKAGFAVTVDERAYSPDLGDPELWGVLLREQELPMYIAHGVLDCGLTGYDWILERGVEL
ncbi:MAG: ATP phosphoribosyltransferase, partial [Armatimonadota bacterium]